MTLDDCTSSIELFWKVESLIIQLGLLLSKSPVVLVFYKKGVEASSNRWRQTSAAPLHCIFRSRYHPIFTQIWRCKSTLIPGVNLWSFQTRRLPDWQSHWLSWADGCANFRVACSNTLRQLKTHANNNPMFGPLVHSFYIFKKLTANSKPPPSLPSLSWHRKKEMSGQPNPTLGMGGCL